MAIGHLLLQKATIVTTAAAVVVVWLLNYCSLHLWELFVRLSIGLLLAAQPIITTTATLTTYPT